MESKSFQRKFTDNESFINGTSISHSSKQLLISTGCVSLDACIGFQAVGNILLVEEDAYNTYASQLVRLYLAEGIACRHEVFVVADDPDEIVKYSNCCLLLLEYSECCYVKRLPSPQSADSGPQLSATEEDMQIAWRYKHTPQAQSVVLGSKLGHEFDLLTTMDENMVDAVKKTCLNLRESSTSTSCSLRSRYASVIKELQNVLTAGSFYTSDTNTHRNILRIALCSVGSPLWADLSCQDLPSDDVDSLCQFLLTLCYLLRNSYASCIITVPTHLFQITSLRRIEHFCDSVLQLESFETTLQKQKSLYRDYQGLLHIVKLPQVNTIAAHSPDTLDLAFKVSRRKFSIERLHLSADVDIMPSSLSSSVGCHSDQSHGGRIDF